MPGHEYHLYKFQGSAGDFLYAIQGLFAAVAQIIEYDNFVIVI